MNTVTDASVQLLKSKLRQGGLYVTKRQVGKTTAILEACEEIGGLKCVIVVPNENTASLVRDRWDWEYPGKKAPFVVPAYRAEYFMKGKFPYDEMWVFVDEFWICREYAGEFHAAIGTPPFHVEVI